MITSGLSHRCVRLALRVLLMGAIQLSGMALAQAPGMEGPSAAPPVAVAPVISVPLAGPEPRLDSGNTAWMLTASALVLFMTLPGVALFYGGMVRKKNVLSMGAQVFVCGVLVSITWTLLGYSLALRPGDAFVGGLDRMLLDGLTADSLVGIDGANIPESVFWMFQLTFAIITTALITGAMAERMKFSALCWFAVLWSLLVYAPIAHWVWEPGGWLAAMGALDFAGGTVVHVSAGVAGLVCALVMGHRRGFGREPMSPHNLTLTMTGAGMLWVGWFGFNAGSAVAANGTAGMAMLVTQIATAFAALAWMCVEWTVRGRPGALGIVSGAVAGLVAITPAAGFVDPVEAALIGSISGVVCYLGATSLKRRFGYDDSLDVFGIHGVGGAVGALLTGVYGVADSSQIGAQVLTQLTAVAAAALYSAVGTFVILVIINSFMGLRVGAEEEREGLDRMAHGEHIE